MQSRAKSLPVRKANEKQNSHQPLSQISLLLVFHSAGTIGEDYSVKEVVILPTYGAGATPHDTPY